MAAKKATKEEKATARIEGVVVVLGPNVYGIAPTLEEARKNAGNPTKWVAYFGPKDTQVCQVTGDLSVPRGTFFPVVIASKGVKK